MLVDRYRLAEVGNRIGVKCENEENIIQAWTEFEQTTLLRYRQCDITKDFVDILFFSSSEFLHSDATS